MASPLTDLQAWIDREMADVISAEPQLPFSRDEYADRLARLRAAMTAAGVDLVVLTSPDSMGWLHGFSSRVYSWHTSTALPPDAATVVHAEQEPMFYVDSAFHEALVRKTSCVEDFRPIAETGVSAYSSLESFNQHLLGELKREGWLGGVVGVERWSGCPPPAAADATRDALGEAGCRVVDATGVIRGVRRLKSPAELGYLEQAQAAVDAGVRRIHERGRAGMSELELWHLYMGGVIEAGGEPSAIHETVAVGPPEAGLHALSGDRRIMAGDYFHPDMSAAVHRYHARGTRPFTVGPPRREVAALAEVIAGAYHVVLETGRVGMPFGQLNRALSSYFEQEGFGLDGAFGGGYELGLSFNPDFVGEFLWGVHMPDDERPIEAGLVTNFESVVFLTMIDTLVFEESGPRFLSSLPLEVLVIDG